MSLTAIKLFEKRAKELGGVDLSRGPYGELLNSETRRLWYMWFQAWRDRTKDINERLRLRRAAIPSSDNP